MNDMHSGYFCCHLHWCGHDCRILFVFYATAMLRFLVCGCFVIVIDVAILCGGCVVGVAGGITCMIVVVVVAGALLLLMMSLPLLLFLVVTAAGAAVAVAASVDAAI